MHRLVTQGLWMLGLAAAVASLALAQEGWGDGDWWQQATLADVQERLDQGAEIFRATWGAARHNENPAVLALLLDRGAAVTERNIIGETLLHEATRYNTPAVIALLLDRGVAVNARTEYGKTPLHEAARHNEDLAVTALLLDRGADLTARGGEFFGASFTPLDGAAQFNANPAVLALLLDRSAVDLTTPDQERHGLLHTAAGFNNPAVVALLLDRGAAVNAQRGSGTPLHSAAAYNEDPAVTALLLDRGAEINARDQWRGTQDWTPLHDAARHNENPAVVALLLDRGADATLRTKDGQLPFDLAKENEHLRGTDVYWRLNDARF